MKISSFYKQQQAIINFAENSNDLKIKYDKMYVVREDPLSGPFPDEIDLLDEKVYLIGNGLKYYSRYMPDIDDVMAACRPDYMLYPLKEENRMTKANIVQFFSGDELLPVIQDYKNTYRKTNDTHVIDKDFWKKDEKDLKKCYAKLKKDNNIIFSDPMDLNLIFSSKLKFEMVQKLKINWHKVKITIELDSDKTIAKFLEFCDSVGPLARSKWNLSSTMVYSGDHFEKTSNWIKDFHKYMNLICILKQKRVHIRMKAPDRLLSPQWYYFEDLEGWTIYGQHLSFIEYMTFIACRDNDATIDYLMRNSIKWNDSVHRLVVLWKRYPEIMESCGYKQWGDRSLEEIKMTDYVKEKR